MAATIDWAIRSEWLLGIFSYLGLLFNIFWTLRLVQNKIYLQYTWKCKFQNIFFTFTSIYFENELTEAYTNRRVAFQVCSLKSKVWPLEFWNEFYTFFSYIKSTGETSKKVREASENNEFKGISRPFDNITFGVILLILWVYAFLSRFCVNYSHTVLNDTRSF